MLGQIKKPDPLPTPAAGKELDAALKELLVSIFFPHFALYRTVELQSTVQLILSCPRRTLLF